MKKRKLKKKFRQTLYIAIGIILLSTFLLFFIKNKIYKNSIDYKLLEKGYTEKEINVFKNNLDGDYLIKLTNEEKNNDIYKFVKSKYYLKKNLDEYLAYQGLHKELEVNKIISLVNTKANNKWYDESIVKPADLSKGYLTLVNKFNYLEKNYEPVNVMNISLTYAYEGKRIIKTVNDAFITMAKDAKKEGATLIVTSGYRTYEEQKILFTNYSKKGETYAEGISAHAGYSEHQLGLALDIVGLNINMSEFENSLEFSWLKENAYKYGFILRYHKDKTDITGYNYESWHYRYVGVDVAKVIYESDITFDEYYAFYVEDK